MEVVIFCFWFNDVMLVQVYSVRFLISCTLLVRSQLMPLYASTCLHLRGKCCTFEPTALI